MRKEYLERELVLAHTKNAYIDALEAHNIE